MKGIVREQDFFQLRFIRMCCGMWKLERENTPHDSNECVSTLARSRAREIRTSH